MIGIGRLATTRMNGYDGQGRRPEGGVKMDESIRVTPDEARKKATSQSALLVCAYDDDEKCKMVHLDGAIFLTEFKSKAPSLPKNREIIFYCA